MDRNYDVVVVGAGVAGLSLCYWLSKSKKRVCLLEQFEIGHAHGSSHSTVRLTRSIYENSLYMEMAQLTRKVYWPLMEQEFKEKLIIDNSFIYFSENKHLYQKYKQISSTSTKHELKSTSQLSKQFDQFPQVKGTFTPIIDRESGIIEAHRYIQLLKQYLIESQFVTVLENTRVTNIDQKDVKVATENAGEFTAGKIVLTCGRWMGEMLPEFRQLVTPVKQYVSFLELKEQEKYLPGRFPAFVHQSKDQDIYYCIPDHGGKGLKFVRHLLSEEPDSEETKNRCKKELETMAKRFFGDRFIRVSEMETCYFTITKDEGFIIDWVDPSEKILAISACSGHGFKFMPLLGKIATDLVLNDKSYEGFEKERHQFKVAYHQGIDLSK